jgi:hypothetical protein
MIHHLSTAMSALQQCLEYQPVTAFPPSQHDSKTVYRECITVYVCVCVCVCVCVYVSMHARMRVFARGVRASLRVCVCVCVRACVCA